MPLFQKSVLNKYLKEQDKGHVLSVYETFKRDFYNPTIQQNILDGKEEQFQERFLRELLVNVFGYVLHSQLEFNLTTEYKNEKVLKKPEPNPSKSKLIEPSKKLTGYFMSRMV